MSGLEFAEFVAFIRAEEATEAHDRLRHAQLLAALHNGPLVRNDKRLFTTADFLEPDPWAPAEPEDLGMSPAAGAAIFNRNF